MERIPLMKFYRAAALLCVIVSLGFHPALGQSYDLQFVVVQNNGTNLDVKVQLRAGGSSFGMGDANLVLTYPTSVLSNPVLLTAHNFNSGLYAPISVTKTSDRASVNVVFDGGVGLGSLVSSSYVDVATLRFSVVNPSGSFNLGWRMSGSGSTVVFNDNFSLMTQGTLSGLSSIIGPRVTAHPVNQSVLIPFPATFSVTATGGGSLSYQWQKNNVDIPGAVGPSYTTPATSFSDSGAIFRCVVTNAAGSATSNGAMLNAITNVSGIFSDDFSAPTLDPRWTLVNPRNDATVSITGAGTSNARLSFSIPGGQHHDLWTNVNTAPRLLQTTANTDFEVILKFESAMTTGTQLIGLVVQQDSLNLVRFDFIKSASTFRIFAATIVNNTATQRYSVNVTQTNPIYLRVQRGRSVWSSWYSSNGTTWTAAPTFSHTMVSQKIGPYVGNAGTTPPAFTGLIDYFFNAQGPISPEDPPASTPPSITSHPSVQSVPTGQTATFNVIASGSNPLSYQWQKNGVDIGGATLPGYTTPATVAGDSGSTYRCRVTNSAGNVTSNSAVLNVGIPPGISSHPANQFATGGGTATFSVTATGNTPLSYQWQKNNVDISGATASSYTTPAVTAGDSGSTFRCRVTNQYGSMTSNAGILSVVAAPSISTPPTNQTVAVGNTATFSIVASGTSPLSYQWQKNNSDISGATSATYITPATTMGDSGSTYRCRVTNTFGNVTSSSAVLHVVIPPSVNTHPSNQTVAVGASASFSVSAAGSTPLTYQWQKNGVPIGGATSSSYNTPATTMGDSGASYRCQISNGGGSVLSNPAILSVLIPPNVTTHPANQTVPTGSTATFTIVAAGSAPLAYQWQKNGADIGGANSSSYTTPTLVAGDSGSTFRCKVTNAVGADTSNAAILTVTSNTDASGILSDNFNAPSLNTSIWTYVNPLGDSPLSMTGNAVSVSIPAGTAHDAWTGGNFAPRILQNANNTNFEVEAKFTSTMNAQYQSQGILAQQDSANYLRFDFVRSSTATRIFSATITNNTATTKSNITITAGNPLYIRVKRVGNTWTSYYSYNGTSWTTAANYSHTLAISKVGLFFVNAGTPPPAFTGVADYFFNTGFPIVPSIAQSIRGAEETPADYSLDANYPNPFNPTTTIRFALPEDSHISLRLYNALGEEIRTLVDDIRSAGFTAVEWDGRNSNGESVASGVYFYRIQANALGNPEHSFTSLRKMILMK